jgi:hypothetical protein
LLFCSSFLIQTFYSFWLTCCFIPLLLFDHSTPFAQLVVLFLCSCSTAVIFLLNLLLCSSILFYSSCLTRCSTILIRSLSSSCSTYCFALLSSSTPFVQPTILLLYLISLLLLNLLFHSSLLFRSSCSTYCFVSLSYFAPLSCFALLAQPIVLILCVVPLFLFDLLLCSFYLICYSIPLTQHVFPLLLIDLFSIQPIVSLNLLLHSSILFHSYYSNCSFYPFYCFTPLVRLAIPLFLLNLLLPSSCSTCCFVQLATLLFLLNLFVQVPLCYACDFITPCSFCLTLLLSSSCFRLVPPLSIFL